MLPLSVSENAILVSHRDPAFDRRGLLISEAVVAFASQTGQGIQIRCAGVNLPIRSLSGGNQQKLVLGRE